MSLPRNVARLVSCAGCGRPAAAAAFLVPDRRPGHRGERRIVKWCPACRARYRAAQLERRITGDTPRQRGEAPRQRQQHPRRLGTSPRFLGTNPHPGKSVARGQWKAAFRRLEQLPPVELHELERECARALERYGPTPELVELERRIAGALAKP